MSTPPSPPRYSSKCPEQWGAAAIAEGAIEAAEVPPVRLPRAGDSGTPAGLRGKFRRGHLLVGRLSVPAAWIYGRTGDNRRRQRSKAAAGLLLRRSRPSYRDDAGRPSPPWAPVPMPGRGTDSSPLSCLNRSSCDADKGISYFRLRPAITVESQPVRHAATTAPITAARTRQRDDFETRDSSMASRFMTDPHAMRDMAGRSGAMPRRWRTRLAGWASAEHLARAGVVMWPRRPR